MNTIPRLFQTMLLVALLAAHPLRAYVDVWFSSAPGTAVPSSQSYYVEGRSWAGNLAYSSVDLWKNGGHFAGNYGRGTVITGGTTADTGPQTVEYYLDGSDWTEGATDFDWAYVTIDAPVQSNQPPIASVTVDGYGSGATITRPYGGSVTVTVRYHATDADGNLTGIRPQVWRPDGNLDNNGGNFVGQSGGSGEVVWSVTLNQNGNWYFWADAQDAVISPNYVDSGSWSSGFRINVVESAPPPQAPSVSQFQPSADTTVTIGTNLTLQSYADDPYRAITVHNLEIQRPDGVWNTSGAFANTSAYIGGPVGPDAPMASLRTAGFTFDQVGVWHVRSRAANNVASAYSETRTVTVAAQTQSAVTISPSSQSINVGQSITFTASGGSGSGAYTWGGDASGTGASSSVTFNTAGTRTVTVYRAGDSTYSSSNVATATITVSLNAQATVQISPVQAYPTVGDTVIFTASGGSGTGAYTWGGDASGTGTSKSVTFSTQGARSVTVYRAGDATYGASNTATASVTVGPPVVNVISTHPQSQTALIGGSVTFSVTAAGTGPFSYQWKKDGVDMAGKTSSTLSLSNLVDSDAAGYSVVVTNSAGTALSKTAWLPISQRQGGGTAKQPLGADISPVPPGLISTMVGDGGYNIQSGSFVRVARDFQVAGSVGAYPLEMTHTFTTKGVGYSFVWWGEELVNDLFLNNPTGQSKDYQQSLNVTFPDGQYLHYEANRDNFPKEYFTSMNAARVAITRDSRNRVTALALHFADGGYLMTEAVDVSTHRRIFRPLILVDGFGLTTTYTYNSSTSAVPYQVTDASGRYLRFTTDGSGAVSRVESSDNKWIQWNAALTELTYWDNPNRKATISTTLVDTNNKYVRFSDVRATSPMRNVEYKMQRFAYGQSGNFSINPQEPAVWEVMEERTFTATDAVGAGTLVSTRTVATRKQVIEEVGTVLTGPAIDVTETRGDGASRRFTFDTGGSPLLTATDFRNNVSTFLNWQYDIPGTIRDALGRETKLESNGWGQITKITHAPVEGQTTGDFRQYTWQDSRYFNGGQDERGFWTYYDRDSQNRIWKIRYPSSGTSGQPGYLPPSEEIFYYNALNQLDQHKLRNGAFEYWTYNTSNLPEKYWPATFNAKADTEPHFEYTYYSTGPQKDLLYTSKDPRGNVTTYEYFDSGRLKKETFHDLTYRSYTYDDWGNRLTVTNERLKVTTTTYDDYNRTKTVTDPLLNTTTYDYTPSRDATKSPYAHVSSAIRRTTFPSTRKNATKYDDDYHITEDIRAEGTSEEAKVVMTYDEVGNLKTRTEQVESGVPDRVTSFRYDARNRRRYQDAPLSRTTEWQYDAASNVLKVINPDATFTTKTYNAMNQVASATDERNHTTSYTYHASGLLNTLTDPRTNVYSHTYEAGGRISTRAYPGSPATSEQWNYDAAGNLWHYTNRSGNVQTFTYDSRNREQTRTWNDGVTPAVSTDYYDDGLVWHRNNSAANLTFTYDDAGRLQTQTQAPAGGSAVTITLNYDADGRRKTFDAGASAQLAYHYNNRGELDVVRLGANPDAGTALATFGYNLAGQRRSRNAGNIGTDYNYDGAGRLNYLNAAGVMRQDFGHDLRDRRKWTLRDQNLGDTYTWFDDGQLNVYRHSVSRPDVNFNNPAGFTDTFAYDEAGNRLTWDENGTTTTYAAANALNQYTTITGPSGGAIGHDGRGNVSTWGSQSFTYDAENRLLSSARNGNNFTFAHDPDGRLVKLTKNGTAEFRYYDGAQCFRRADASGTVLDWTVWGPTPDEVIARQTGGAWHYYHQDQINSVYAVTDASGLVLERYLYDPFGLPDVRDSNGNARTATVIGNLWLFTGQEWRDDLQLSNYKARWYQPTLGRFIQTDPARFAARDINLYRYCFNDPFNYNDPSGRFVLVDDAVYVTVGLVVAVAYVAASPEGKAAIKSAVDSTVQAVKDAVSKPPVPIYIDPVKYPEAAKHAKDAIDSGVPPTGVIDREGKNERRRENLKDVPKSPGKDRDEFPPAIVKPDGGTSVRPIAPSDNRGAGGSLGQQTKDLPDGTTVVVKPETPPPPPTDNLPSK